MVSRCIWRRSSGVERESWEMVAMVAQLSIEDIGQTGQSRTVREAGREGLHGYLQHPPTSTNMPDSTTKDGFRLFVCNGSGSRREIFKM